MSKFTYYPNQMSQKLSYTECLKIQIFLEEGLKHRCIARKLGRGHSSISDEIKKHAINGKYIANIAWLERNIRRRLANTFHYKIQRGSELDLFIVAKVKEYWSPEQIAGRHKRETGESISKDTIYSHIKRNHPDLIKKYFRRKGKKYKYGTIKAGYIYDRRSIHERPLEATYRKELGHWEGDTVRGAKRKGGFLTFTERKSGYELAYVLDEKTARNVTIGTHKLFKNIPRALRKTVTLDNGREFVEHFMRKGICGLDTYFADVGNAGQRGLNENTNGLIRQFYPKKSDLGSVKQKELDYYIGLFNLRPRKRLQYLSPKEVFQLSSCPDLN